MQILTYFTVAIIWISTCNTKMSKRIAGGGKTAFPGDYPFFVQLKIIDKLLSRRFISTRICGGGLIQTKWVLTAASCFYDIRKRLPQLARRNNLIVYAGTIVRFGRNGTKNFIKKVIMHPDYYEKLKHGIVLKMKNDIAVAELKKEYAVNTYIKPSSVPATGAKCKQGSIMGIGLVESNNDENFPVNVLVDYQVPTKSIDELITPVERPMVDTLFYTEISTHGNKAYLTPGDTGGPFRCQAGYLIPIIYGINSRVTVFTDSSSGTVYHVGYFESVYAHMGFILDHVPNVSQKVVETTRKPWLG